MKQVMTGILMLGAVVAQGQTFNEWFRQKKTQIDYYVKQIAALKIYAQKIQDGYAIVQDGLSVIDDIKQGDFNLHNGYFSSLSAINPRIAQYGKVSDIVSLHTQIIQQIKQSKELVKESQQFSEEDVEYVFLVYDHLLEECNANIDQLMLLTTANHYALTDDERLGRIDALHADMHDKYAFCKHFHRGVAALGGQRYKEQADAKGIELIYDIKP